MSLRKPENTYDVLKLVLIGIVAANVLVALAMGVIGAFR